MGIRHGWPNFFWKRFGAKGIYLDSVPADARVVLVDVMLLLYGKPKDITSLAGVHGWMHRYVRNLFAFYDTVVFIFDVAAFVPAAKGPTQRKRTKVDRLPPPPGRRRTYFGDGKLPDEWVRVMRTPNARDELIFRIIKSLARDFVLPSAGATLILDGMPAAYRKADRFTPVMVHGESLGPDGSGFRRLLATPPGVDQPNAYGEADIALVFWVLYFWMEPVVVVCNDTDLVCILAMNSHRRVNPETGKYAAPLYLSMTRNEVSLRRKLAAGLPPSAPTPTPSSVSSTPTSLGAGSSAALFPSPVCGSTGSPRTPSPPEHIGGTSPSVRTKTPSSGVAAEHTSHVVAAPSDGWLSARHGRRPRSATPLATYVLNASPSPLTLSGVKRTASTPLKIGVASFSSPPPRKRAKKKAPPRPPYLDVNRFCDVLEEYMGTMAEPTLDFPVEHVFMCMILSGSDFCEGFYRLTGQTLFDTYLTHFEAIGPLISADGEVNGRATNVSMRFHEDAFSELLRIAWGVKLKLGARASWTKIREVSQERQPDDPRQHAPSKRGVRGTLRRTIWTLVYWKNGVLETRPDELARCKCCDSSLYGFQDAAEPDEQRDIYFTDIVCRRGSNPFVLRATSPASMPVKTVP